MMKKRLKNYYKKQKLSLMQSVTEGGPTDAYYDFICVVDFEATCEQDNPLDFTHEIIEFPMVLFNTHTLDIVSEEGTLLESMHCKTCVYYQMYGPFEFTLVVDANNTHVLLS